METGKIQLSDKSEISKILNRNNYLIIVVGIIFLFIDLDLFASNPKLFITEDFYWKVIAVVIQIIFMGTLIQWEFKKQRIIEILSNGTIIRGKLKFSENIKPNDTSSFYIHFFKYKVNNKKYEVTFKNKNKSVESDFIIYQTNNPKNSIVYQGLKKDLKKIIAEKVKKNNSW